MPPEQVIDIGRQARLECLTEERDRTSILWRKDGEVIPPSSNIVQNRQTLQIFNIERTNYGMYQCFVTRGNREVEARGELRLGGRSTWDGEGEREGGLCSLKEEGGGNFFY